MKIPNKPKTGPRLKFKYRKGGKKAINRTKSSGLNKLEKTQVKKIISDRKETKYCPAWFKYDDYAAYGNYVQPRITGATTLSGIFDSADRAVTMVGLQTGQYLNTASQQVNAAYTVNPMYPLGGWGMERGDSSQTIDGDYAYLQSSCIKLQISAEIDEAGGEGSNAVSTPLQFRVLQLRSKKDAAGTTPSLMNDMFLDLVNEKEGLNMSGSVKEIMKDYKVNTNRFIKVKDFSFKLTQPVKPSTQIATASNVNALLSNLACAQTPAHPNQKDITLWLNKPSKKLRFRSTDDGASNYFEPVNYDYIDYVIILCSRNTFNDSYTTGGGTASQSTLNAWTVAVTGQTKFRDC